MLKLKKEERETICWGNLILSLIFGLQFGKKQRGHLYSKSQGGFDFTIDIWDCGIKTTKRKQKKKRKKEKKGKRKEKKRKKKRKKKEKKNKDRKT